MRRLHENEAVNLLHYGTNERSASAMLDRETERELFALYLAFFTASDQTRAWNLWNDVAWGDDAAPAPDPKLVESVMATYRDASMMPDYCQVSVAITRASRGRTWFFTRWSYDETKRLLVLGEWLTRHAKISDDTLKEQFERQLTAHRWAPAADDAVGLLVDTLLYELSKREVDVQLAESGDAALESLAGFLLRDDDAHIEFFRDALIIIAGRHLELVRDAIEQVAASYEAPPATAARIAAYIGV